METEIKEKIKVVSLFEKGQIKPLLFSWQNRLYHQSKKTTALSVDELLSLRGNFCRAGQLHSFDVKLDEKIPRALPVELHKILQVAFSYSKNVGKEKIFYFSVETEGGGFELSFNREKFSWEIEKVFS